MRIIDMRFVLPLLALTFTQIVAGAVSLVRPLASFPIRQPQCLPRHHTLARSSLLTSALAWQQSRTVWTV